MNELSPLDSSSSKADMTAALEDSRRANIRLYAIEVGREPLLTEEEEAILGHLIRDGQAARQLIAEDNPTEEERTELEIDKILGDEAWDRMVKSNLRLVISIAKSFDRRSMPLLDAVQEGNLGLFRAADHFNPNKGIKFSTYAYEWIWGSIQRGIVQRGRMVRLPEHIYYVVTELLKLEVSIEAETGTKPDAEVLAENMEVPVEDVKKMRLMKDPISLEAWLEANSLLSDQTDAEAKVIPLVDRRTVDEGEVSVEEFNTVLPSLTRQQEDILRRLVGVARPRQSIDEIADELDIQRASVEKAIARALKRSGISLPDARRKTNQ
ncbi:MAG TPA: sigma-70 family RNA polymerase sigma factor [Candidatus Saccharimonadales bacterium]|nr:sigma-70 family RNA polymerase sigma factor [Candidatus Saccharimonadales bacterium]